MIGNNDCVVHRDALYLLWIFTGVSEDRVAYMSKVEDPDDGLISS